MGNVVGFTEYLEKEKNLTLQTIAATVFFQLGGDFADKVKVLTGDGPVDLAGLEPGYYMRFINLGKGGFHLYGFEVHSPTDIWVHENISKSQFHNHKDEDYLPALIELNSSGRVKFHTAKTTGGGLDLHTNLAGQYAKNGWIEKPAELASSKKSSPQSKKPGTSPGLGSILTQPYEANISDIKTPSSSPIPEKEKQSGTKPVVDTDTVKSSQTEPELVEEHFENIQIKVNGLLQKLQDKIIREENKDIKQSAQQVYNQLDGVFKQFQSKVISKRELQEKMQGLVKDALPKFNKAPTWKTFFLNILRSIANLFLSEENQYSLFRPKSHEGLKEAQKDIEELNSKENISPSNRGG